MLEILNIPPAPLPGGALGMLIGLLAILAALVVMLFGRVVVWRVLSAAGMGVLGILIGRRLAPALGLGLLWPTAVAGAIGAIIGAGLARICWAVLLAGILSAVALLCVLYKVLPAEAHPVPAGLTAASETFGAWVWQCGQLLWYWLRWMNQNHTGATVVATAVASLLGLIVGIARPVFTRILATSGIGSAACVTGICIIIGSIKSDFDFTSGRRGWIMLGIGAGLWLIAMVGQYRSELRSEKKTDETAEAAPPAKKKK
ncbi:MAG: hypothetical protein HQ546_08660 [Planctomycetes bacterium]|nr:hypothetical protein [Planctomycetota bacterium]